MSIANVALTFNLETILILYLIHIYLLQAFLSIGSCATNLTAQYRRHVQRVFKAVQTRYLDDSSSSDGDSSSLETTCSGPENGENHNQTALDIQQPGPGEGKGESERMAMTQRRERDDTTPPPDPEMH